MLQCRNAVRGNKCVNMVRLLFIQSGVLSTIVTQSDVDCVKVSYVCCLGFWRFRQLKLCHL